MPSRPSSPSSSYNEMSVRPCRPADREALRALAPRLLIGMAPWRDPQAMLAAMSRFIEEDVERMGEQSTVLVAEAGSGGLLGFVTIGHQVNFTGETQAYIGELAVPKHVEGRGVGAALVRAAEEWAHRHGYSLVVLDTGAANLGARRFYKRLGYREESVRLVHVLEPAGSEAQ